MFRHLSEQLLTKHAENVIDLAISNVKAGGLPFSAIIVNQHGEFIGAGVNQVDKNLDCTAHAEIQAIREASQHEKSASLKGSTLIASGEPCALCYMAIHMAGIMKVAVVSDRYEAKKYGFDYLWTYTYLKHSLIHNLDIVTLDSGRKLLPFKIARMNFTDES